MTTKPTDVAYNYSNSYNSRAKLVLLNRFNIEWWLKDFVLPSLSIPVLQQQLVPNIVSIPGSGTIVYDEFSCSSFVDEEFKVWQEAYDWMITSVAGDNYTDPTTSAMLLVYNNQMTSVIKKFMFTGLFIKNMSSLQFNNFGNDELTLSLSFAYDIFAPL